MKILIIGGAGMVGRKLSERLAKDGQLGGREISELTMYDVVAPTPPKGAKFKVHTATGDLPAKGETDKLVANKPDVIFPSGGDRLGRGGTGIRQRLPHQSGGYAEPA